MSPKERSEITEETRVPLKTTVAICFFVAVIVGWASRVESGISAIAATRRDVDGFKETLLKVRMDLRLVKERLGIPKDAKPSEAVE